MKVLKVLVWETEKFLTILKFYLMEGRAANAHQILIWNVAKVKNLVCQQV